MSKCAEFKFDLICEIILTNFFPGSPGFEPGEPGKKFVKMISQIRSNLNSAHLDIISLSLSIYIYIYLISYIIIQLSHFRGVLWTQTPLNCRSCRSVSHMNGKNNTRGRVRIQALHTRSNS